MDFRLVEHRSVNIIKDMIENCKKRLNYTLKTIITDGFRGYQGAINALRYPVIHVRHIHQPPYDRIEVNCYKYYKNHVKIHSIKTSNNISVFEGYFIGIVQKEKKFRNSEKRKKTKRKKPTKRSFLIEKEKRKKENRKRGRHKGSKNKKNTPNYCVFYHYKKEDCVRAVSDSLKEIVEGLTQVFKQFPRLHITTNLVEN